MNGALTKPVSIAGVVLLVFAAVQLSACAGEAQEPLGKAATELAELLESEPQLRSMLAASIDHEIGISSHIEWTVAEYRDAIERI